MNSSKCLKKAAVIGVASALALSFAACGNSGNDNKDDPSAKSSSQAVQEPELPVQTAAAHKQEDSLFNKYQSNTVVATGNNFLITKADSVTYRAYFPLEEYGDLEYRFYFSNEIDSTYDRGDKAHIGGETGSYTVTNARIADGGTSVEDEITNYTDVTFDGNSGKDVEPGEDYWSDPVQFSLEEGHYLVWEWTVSGEKIPCTNMSTLTSTTSSEDGEEFSYCDQIPLPQLVGCDREAKYTIAAIGDSITQGCMTEFMAYEFWAAQISQKLGADYSLWNCGLGWARSSDAATKGNWLERAKNADIAIVAFGTNDIISGEYGAESGNTAEEIEKYVRDIVSEFKDTGCSVVVFNAPPQDYDEEHEKTRTDYNEMLKRTCAELGVYYFDFASYLSTPENPAAAVYGGHPNGEAGGIVSDAFVEAFSVLLGR